MMSVYPKPLTLHDLGVLGKVMNLGEHQIMSRGLGRVRDIGKVRDVVEKFWVM